jgi:hypothetical protein
MSNLIARLAGNGSWLWMSGGDCLAGAGAARYELVMEGPPRMAAFLQVLAKVEPPEDKAALATAHCSRVRRLKVSWSVMRCSSPGCGEVNGDRAALLHLQQCGQAPAASFRLDALESGKFGDVHVKRFGGFRTEVAPD